jgi:hypothetical protein
MAGYRGKYRHSYRGRYFSGYRHAPRSGSERARQHIEEAEALRSKYGDAFERIKTLFLNLEADRIERLMEAYTARYGHSAGDYAAATYSRWRNGQVRMAGQTMVRLFDLLPRFMTPDEKLRLIQSLREQTLRRLHRSQVKLTLSEPSDLTAVLRQVIGLVQRVGQIELPDDFREVQGWISEADSQAMDLLLKETEGYIATQRLADLMVQLATLSRLHELAATGLRLRVSTRFEIPTAVVEIDFGKGYWNIPNAPVVALGGASMAGRGGTMTDESSSSRENDTDLIVRLQELALREEHQGGNISYVDYVMRTLSPEEQRQLRALAATEGLRTEVLLKELQVKTLAARGDIQSVMDTAAELKAKGHNSKISSEHQTASGVTRIEIDNRKAGLPGCSSVIAIAAVVGTAVIAAGAALLR